MNEEVAIIESGRAKRGYLLHADVITVMIVTTVIVKAITRREKGGAVSRIGHEALQYSPCQLGECNSWVHNSYVKRTCVMCTARVRADNTSYVLMIVLRSTKYPTSIVLLLIIIT